MTYWRWPSKNDESKIGENKVEAKRIGPKRVRQKRRNETKHVASGLRLPVPSVSPLGRGNLSSHVAWGPERKGSKCFACFRCFAVASRFLTLLCIFLTTKKCCGHAAHSGHAQPWPCAVWRSSRFPTAEG